MRPVTFRMRCSKSKKASWKAEGHSEDKRSRAAILDFYRSLSQGKEGHSRSTKKLVGEDVIKGKGGQKKDGKCHAEKVLYFCI